ncbi:membrane protein [Bradyrhizobium sp. SSBR45G]|uniref:glycosyltransferase family 39 protein n=1 Tax=unclassified Bradyrhizobium TaxID=2631580 RepID=UPI002342A13F|nr:MULTISPECIES: glycosyltransferase family 39 protein [unclassified Bradyrhizobium]GLH81622.1 membrane protein [Bradyrhizobium sp. SSBR45G]GLH88250.1 membrane protein [Bradyrhizobium sp. SSBR45R]
MSLALPALVIEANSCVGRWRKTLMVWIDAVEDGWVVPALIAGFVAVWMIYFSLAYMGGDLHQDVIETWSLGRSFDWGSTKHPPLMGWAARAWTTVFPLTNWSFNLLALTNAAVGLWAIDRITRRFAHGDKRIVVLLLLMLLPIYQLHAQRFNANAVLLSSWPLATWCFLRSFETRQFGWAIAAGLTAALAMLGKYYSIFLIAGFAIAALCHSERRAYFTSWAPWIAAVSGLVALVPHLYWLATTGAQPFSHAIQHHVGKTTGAALVEGGGFLLAMAGIAGIPGLIWLAMTRPRPGRVLNDALSLDSGLQLLAMIGIGTVTLPAWVSAIFGTDMPPLWGLQGVFLFVIVTVCGASYQAPRALTVNLAASAIGIAAFAAIVVAPLHALYRNYVPLSEGRNFYQPAVAELDRLWRTASDSVLPAVGGDDGLAFAAAFYSPDHPRYEMSLVHPHELQPPAPELMARGWAALCYETDISCVTGMQGAAARARHSVRATFTLRTNLFGWQGASQGFVALIVPPETEQPAPKMPGGAYDLSARRRVLSTAD